MISYTLLDRVATDPQIYGGKPVIKGAWVPVELILKKLAEGVPAERIVQESPRLTAEDVKAAAYYAAKLLESTPH
jgi:uncharacterized protein (DUF433 family)